MAGGDPDAAGAEGGQAPDSLQPTDTGTEATAADGTAAPTPPAMARPTRFYATAELDPVLASSQFARIVEELVGLFTMTPGTRVRIRVDIDAEDERGFGETTVRAARENSTTLGLKPADFE